MHVYINYATFVFPFVTLARFAYLFFKNKKVTFLATVKALSHQM